MSGGDAYRRAGVDIDAQDKALARVKKLARSTFTPGVLSELGSFGGLFRLDCGSFVEPVLVASADGVGTKLRVAQLAGDYSTVGTDLVCHSVNDILVQGARPLFFLDYVGAGVLDPAAMVQLVEGVARGCRDNGCALLGGETAEMPGFYRDGDYELVGFIVGVVDRQHLLGASRVRPGDLVVGLPSAGLHTNGYSLARHVFFERMGLRIGDCVDDLPGRPRLRDVLLAPHLSYQAALSELLLHPALHALAHITGGGLTDNLPRVLPDQTHVEIRLGAWEIPPLFHLLQERGEVATEEMLRVFNMGIGMVALVAPEGLREVLRVLKAQKVTGSVIGSVQKGGRGVVFELERRAEEKEP